MSSTYICEPATNGKVCLHTTVGDIDLELWSKECPLACRNFVQLCMENYYSNCKFHRLVKDFIVQGGDPTNTGIGGESIYMKPFKSEFHQRLKFCRRGLVGMASSETNCNGSQFFFTLNATPELNNQHTLFGKVVGDTLFNMLRLGECEVDENERPRIENKIIKCTILNNPFPDIQLRKVVENKQPNKVKKKIEEKKNFSLLSFGDEAQEDENELSLANSELKCSGKSAHDILSEANLCKDAAVKPEELEICQKQVDSDDDDEISRIRKRLMMKRVKKEEDTFDQNLDDLDDLLRQTKEDEEQRKLEEVRAEVREMQRKYRRALKTPQAKRENNEDDEPKSEALQMYHDIRTKFLTKSKNILKANDSKRETQTMELLAVFEAKLNSDHVKNWLDQVRNPVLDRPKKVEYEEVSEKTNKDDVEEDQEHVLGRVDLDASDLKIEEILDHEFIATPDSTEVSKSKDANMREESEDWYPLDDPRNKMNKRRRGEE